MKRLLHLLFFLLIVTSADGQVMFSRWSASIDGGYNTFNGDFMGHQTTMQDRYEHYSWGATVDFTHIPFLSYGFAFNSQYIQAKNNGKWFETDAKNFYPFIEVNFFNIFFEDNPYNFGLWVHIGYGTSFYKTMNSSNSNTWSETKQSFIFPYGVTLELSIMPQLSLGVGIKSISYYKDDLEGDNKDDLEGDNIVIKDYRKNDFITNPTISLRYKFANKKVVNLRDYPSGKYFTMGKPLFRIHSSSRRPR